MKLIKYGLLLSLSAFAASQASANLIVNGNFAAGNTGFSSAYNYIVPAGQGSLYPEGAYTVDTDPNLVHNLWASFGASPGNGSANMLIVNGAASPIDVWTGSLNGTLTQGTTYRFSADVANLYSPFTGQAVNPAALQFTVGGNMLGAAYTATGVGQWNQFTATFTATAAEAGLPLITIFDSQFAASGNDFALDNISLTAVPEPTTMVAGAMLLLPFGISTLRMLRKSRMA